MKYYWLLNLIFCGMSLQAQTLSGKVVDAKTLEPLPFANVFLNNTTIGTTTELNGDFILKNMRQPAIYEVVFSYVGYESCKMKVSVTENRLNLDTIRLKQVGTELTSVEIKAKKDTQWEKKLKKFKKIFLGEDSESELCNIVNPWVIDFSNQGNKLLAVSSAPIEIENKALGYKINFHLKNFQSNSTTYIIEGNVRFDEMEPGNETERNQWSLNRTKSYLHSRQHLFKAMVDHRIQKEGFSLYTEMNDENIPTRTAFFYSQLGGSIEVYDTTHLVALTGQSGIYRINIGNRMEVHYRKEKILIRVYRDVFNPVSWITLSKGYVLVNKDGVELNPTDVVVSGDMNKDRVAHLLPINYLPEVMELEEQMQELLPLLEEKIYVHTDKPYYYPGEAIWCKGYVNYRTPSLRDSLSKTVYVDLWEKHGANSIQSKTYRIDSGVFHGDFQLPNNLIPGSYYLRTYTNLNRNFGDENLYVKSIPVLHLADKVKEVDLADEIIQDSSLIILTDKTKYRAREKITLTIMSKDEDELPIVSNLSVSVTDASQVTPLRISENITSGYALREKYSVKGDLAYPIEYGVKFNGRLYNDKHEPEQAVLNVFQLNPRNFSMTQSNEKGFFLVEGFSFYDTATFSIQAIRAKGEVYGRVELIKREVPAFVYHGVDHPIELFKAETPQRIQYKPSEDAIMLDVVEIKAKKIQEEYTMEYRMKRPYGKPNYVLKAKDINTAYGNLLMALPGKFPGLVVRQANNPGEPSRWVVYLQRSMGAGEVLITVNDFYVGGDAEQILSMINPNDVESIELKSGVNVLYGASGFYGVLSVYTKNGQQEEMTEVKKNIPIVKVMGYSKPTQFSHPDYSKTKGNSSSADYRSLLYWNPNVNTSMATGAATISFFASDLTGRYRVIVEGITSQGKPVYCTILLDVENK